MTGLPAHLARGAGPGFATGSGRAASARSGRVRKLPAKEFFLPSCTVKYSPRSPGCQAAIRPPRRQDPPGFREDAALAGGLRGGAFLGSAGPRYSSERSSYHTVPVAGMV